jgi:uncharacterized protein DUF4386
MLADQQRARLFGVLFLLTFVTSIPALALYQPVLDDPIGYIAWTQDLGPGWVVGWGNGLILGYLMYRSGLVPRAMAVLGLVAGPLIILSGTLVMFDVGNKQGTFQAIATIPEFLWELSLGIYCTVKGFKPSSPILHSDDGASARAGAPA